MVLILSAIFGAMALICSIDIIFFRETICASPSFIVFAVVMSTLAEVAIDGLFAFIVNNLPNKWFKNKKFFNVSKKEQRFYEKLGVHSWKDKVWELGGLGGFSKSKLSDPSDPMYIERFLIESYKGEIDHIVGIIMGFTVIFVFPLRFALFVGVPVAIVNMILNCLPIMILRYNTPKLMVLHKRAVRNKERRIQE